MAAHSRRVAEQRSTTHDRCRDAGRRGDDSSSRYPDRRADADRAGHAPAALHDPGSHHQGAGNLGQVGVNHARGDDDPAEGDHHAAQGDTTQPKVTATPTEVKSTATATPTQPTNSWPTCTRMW